MRFSAATSLSISILLCLTSSVHSTSHHNSPRTHTKHQSRRERLFRDIGVALSSLVTPRNRPEAKKAIKRSAVVPNSQCALKAAGHALTSTSSTSAQPTPTHPVPQATTSTSSSSSASSTSTHKATSTSTSTSTSTTSTTTTTTSTTSTTTTTSSPSPTPTSPWIKKLDASGSSFFDGWNFPAGTDDGTHGIVLYQSEDDARANNLISIDSSGYAIMSVEATPQVPGIQKSVRIETSAAFTGGLWILDALHMPSGCGTWPAFWTHGPNWPAGGEIDIVEGVNSNSHNQASLHTTTGCQLTPNSGYTGTMVDGTVCDSSTPGDNTGCGLMDTNPNSFGAAFNQNNGGVYATLWDDTGVSIWFFPRNAIPSDISSQVPDPTSWGAPFANWAASGCAPYTFLQQHTTTFDTTLCGDWGDGTWAAAPNGGGPSCQETTGAPSCEAFIQNNGGALSEAYWRVKSVRVYQTS